MFITFIYHVLSVPVICPIFDGLSVLELQTVSDFQWFSRGLSGFTVAETLLAALNLDLFPGRRCAGLLGLELPCSYTVGGQTMDAAMLYPHSRAGPHFLYGVQ